MTNYTRLPKIELHVHLDGSVRLETAAQLLDRNINEVKYEMIAKEKCEDLNAYLTKFELPAMVMQTSRNLERVAYELAVDMKNDGVLYAEVRFAPSKHILEGLSLYDVVESVIMGLRRVDLKTNVILCMMRGDNLETNMKVIDVAKHYLNQGVCAVDLAGAEAIYKTEDFRELFEYSKEKKVPFTIHAGEADGRESIKSAIDSGAPRIGHGVNIITEDDLIKEVISKNILLEVCPTSNIQTKVVDSYKNHPIKKLYDMNVPISINTDNRTVSNITLKKEYQHLENSLGFTMNDFIKINKMAIEHAFISEIEKKDLLNKFNSLL